MYCISCRRALPPDLLPTPHQTQALLDTLRSPYTPPESHTSHYLSAIASSTAALAQYDAAIAEMQANLQRMLSERSAIQGYLDGCRAVFAPVRRLPAEIWCNIFAQRFSEDFSSMAKEEGEMRSLAKWDLVQISRVCRRWHQIVMGTPALWCDIKVRGFRWPKNMNDPVCRSLLRLLSLSLKRAPSHPLKIPMPWSNLMSQSVGETVFQFLANKSHRQWQEITMSPADLRLLRSMPMIRGNLHLLEELTLNFGTGPADAASIDVFEGAPKLTRVRLIETNCCPRLPWSQLRTFTVEAVGFGSMREIAWSRYLLSLLPSTLVCPMSSLIIDFDIRWTDLDFAAQSLGHLVSCMTLPRVYTLSLRAYNRVPILWPKDQFRALSLHSSFRDTLRVLDIPDIIISTDGLLHALLDMASLERLVISDFRHRFHYEPPQNILITDTLFHRLGQGVVPDFSPQRLLPRLKHLHCSSLFKFSGDTYFMFVLSRIDNY